MIKKTRLLHHLLMSLTIFAMLAVLIGCNENVTDSQTDTTAPTVSSTNFDDGATDISITGTVTATFSEAMDPATISDTNFTLNGVAGSVSYVNKVATFTPDANLVINTDYTATISTGVKDLAGNALAEDKVWTFTTEEVDTTAPEVVLTSPLEGATDRPITSTVTANFSETIVAATILAKNFTLTNGTTEVDGSVTYVNKVATFTPDANLAADEEYTATISTGVTDLAGNALAEDKVWTFTTAASITSADKIDLASARNYVMLAKSGISTTGVTEIIGDIGVSPVGSTYLTGFSLTLDTATGTFSTSGYLTGKAYAPDYTAPTPSTLTVAIGDMENAYTQLAGLPAATEASGRLDLGAGTIGASTQALEPGTYTWGTGLNITGDIELSGDASDIWVFQVANDLVVADAVNITLTGGAVPENVYWQIGTSAAIGTTVQMKGTILAGSDIALNTGAAIDGRLYAKTAVTLEANTVVTP